MNKVFTASNGAQIGLLQNFFNQKNSWPYGIKDFHEFVQRCFVESDYPKQHLPFFFGKAVLTSYFIETMKSTFGEMPAWHRMLDIGTGPSIPPRLLKALGVVDEVWAIDILDRRDDYPDHVCIDHINKLQTAIKMDNKQDLEYLKKTIADYRNLYTQNPMLMHEFFNPDKVNKEKFSWNEYIVADFLEDQIEFPKFDLITGFLCLDYFKPEPLFNKVAGLLESAGTFFFNATNWYEVWGGAMNLPMDAPWLHARVTKDDLLAYYRDFHPEIYEDVQKAVYMNINHMTYKDFIHVGEKAGLEFKGFRRTIDESLMNSFYFVSFNYVCDPVLKQARQINPLVCMEDLFTRNITMVFQKK